MAAPSGSTGANRQSLPFLPTIPKENPTEVWLDLQGPGPAPSRDHHQLILKANDQVHQRQNYQTVFELYSNSKFFRDLYLFKIKTKSKIQFQTHILA
jgi:hypothetical protein